MTDPAVPSWLTQTPSVAALHKEPPLNYQWESLTEDALAGIRKKLVNSILQFINAAFQGFFIPGGDQFAILQQWASDLADQLSSIPIVGEFLSQLESVIGDLDYSSPAAFFASLVNAIMELPDVLAALLGALVDTLVTLPDIVTSLLTTFVAKLAELTGVDLSVFLPLLDLLDLDFSSPTAFLASAVDAAMALPGVLLQVVEGVLSTDWAQGLVPFSSALSAIPILGSGQLQNVAKELLINPLFETLNSFLPSGGIVWDTISHALTGGSAKFTPDGTMKSLLGNAIEVVAGDVLNLSVWTKWDGLTGSGPISLVVNAYDAFDNLIDAAVQVIDSVAMPGLTGDWTQLLGSYTVADGLGIASIAARFKVSSMLTGGSVWFSDASVKKPNLVLPDIIGGPGAILDTLTDEWTLLFDTLGDASGSTITTIENRLADFLNSVSLLNADNIQLGNLVIDRIEDLQTNFTNLVTTLLGWDAPASGTWYSPADALAALAAQAETVLGHGGLLNLHDSTIATHIANFANLFARVGALETAGGGSVSGGPSAYSLTDDFEYSGALASNWTVSDSAYQVDGHSAYWNVTSYSTRTATCIWSGTGSQGASDYQRISVVIGDYAPHTTGSFYGWNYVHGRCSSLGAAQCTFAVRSDGYWEFRVSSSVIASGTTTPLGVGGSMTLFCGDKPTSTLNKFKLQTNLAVVWTGTATSSTGSGNRGWGFGSGMAGTGSSPFGSVAYGGKVNSFSAVDVT